MKKPNFGLLSTALLVLIALSVGFFYMKNPFGEPAPTISASGSEPTPTSGTSDAEFSKPIEPVETHQAEIEQRILQSESSSTDSLAIESTMMNAGNRVFNQSMVSELLKSDEFEVTFKQFQDQQINDTYATELTSDYSDLLRAYQEVAGELDFQFEDLSCGHDMCIGRITTVDADETMFKLVTQYLGREGNNYFGTIINHAKQTDESTYEQRFVFTVDPDNNIAELNWKPGDSVYWLGSSPNDGSSEGGEIKEGDG